MVPGFGLRCVSCGAILSFFQLHQRLDFDRTSAAQHATDRWDQSVFYQIYLASRILAAGGRLGALDISAVRKDVQINGHRVPTTYASRWRKHPGHFNLAIRA